MTPFTTEELGEIAERAVALSDRYTADGLDRTVHAALVAFAASADTLASLIDLLAAREQSSDALQDLQKLMTVFTGGTVPAMKPAELLQSMAGIMQSIEGTPFDIPVAGETEADAPPPPPDWVDAVLNGEGDKV